MLIILDSELNRVHRVLQNNNVKGRKYLLLLKRADDLCGGWDMCYLYDQTTLCYPWPIMQQLIYSYKNVTYITCT